MKTYLQQILYILIQQHTSLNHSLQNLFQRPGGQYLRFVILNGLILLLLIAPSISGTGGG